jgi:hypothetical protein
MFLLIARAIKSVGPPGANGTTKRTGLFGKSVALDWACALCAKEPSTITELKNKARANQRSDRRATEGKPALWPWGKKSITVSPSFLIKCCAEGAALVETHSSPSAHLLAIQKEVFICCAQR